MSAPQIRKVLMTTDLSEASWAALPWARDLAGKYGAELCVCSVVEEPSQYLVPGPVPIAVPPLQQWMEEAERHVRQRIEEHLSEQGVKAQPLVVRSLDVATTVLEQLEAWSADLLVIATHGRTGLSHLLLGSVAEKLVRRCPCPVVTVRVAGD